MKQVKHWQDPVNVLLGVWMILSPWVLGFQDMATPAMNAVVVGLALAAAALGATFVPRAWEEWSEGILGAWMIVSPWVLGFHEVRNAVIATVLTGVVVMVLALWVLATDKDYAWTKKPAH